MPNHTNTAANQRKADIPIALTTGILLLFFTISGIVTYWNTHMLRKGAEMVANTHEVILALENLMSTLKDSESGQRGYVITGDERYLQPYYLALTRINDGLTEVKRLTAENAEQQTRLPELRTHIQNKLNELAETIELRRSKGFDAAHLVVVSDRGKNDMDAIRAGIGQMQQQERELRARRMLEMDGAYRTAIVSGAISALIGIMLSFAIAHFIRREAKMQRRQTWLQTGDVTLSAAMVGEQRIEQLGDNVLRLLTEYVGAQAGAFYVKNANSFNRISTFGIASDGKTPESFTMSEGLLGQAAKDKKTFILKNINEEYLTIGSALGKGKPRHLLIAPVIADNETNAVIELGFFNELDEVTKELLERVSDAMGMAVKSSNYRTHLQNLLEETQRQAEELQAQGEELRVNNEELEEQGRALKESQARLEQQQVEMEQTNAQLEEQTQLLEGQRDDLARTKASVQLKAQELEKASQYKSDFLANMSHELRTPLNSSLILAKLLGDNTNGNLTDEQVEFAKTIQSSGNDLLMLINDILDLSKIEAGHMEVDPAEVALERIVKDITRVFEPVVKQKGLVFETSIAPGTGDIIETDQLRLEQVLKNLLSNALKFTQQGKVTLAISSPRAGYISFAVSDTGIGIEPEQQHAIFEAFRQADGTISRRYGGTGLGLSISRELARLLGGTIELASEAQKGSTFTITIPVKYDANVVMPEMPTITPITNVYQEDVPAKPNVVRKKRVQDDREKLDGNSRIILVVEDDASFSRVLYDLIREHNFQCLVADTAEEALAVARQYLPSAVVLDVGLPDNSGLSVLDRLKRDARTRHIPVHVVSANDHAQTAFSLGAVGYMIKPVKRDELSDTLKKLETKFNQRMRRVLIVEDDAVQLESMRKLLGSQDVQTVGVSTANDCLAQLKEQTFDCMVLDLSLPDASGYELLETLSREDAYSFPPVIVYTGRELSADEEQRLRRYSKSIIIKGAKSPERLLDEVTLFLHQVVSELPQEQQRMLEKARNRDSVLEGRRILVVEDDVRNVYALTSIFEPLGAIIQIARNGREGIEMLDKSREQEKDRVDLVLMDVMMPEMDGITATREIRKQNHWRKLPIIMLTAKAMKDDQERCLSAGANDYMAKPLDVEKLLSLVRVWMPR